jgi:uncharacterized protein (TIGR03435 family)
VPGTCAGQTEPSFEVASIKIAAPVGLVAKTGIWRRRGGPGTADPTRLIYQNVPLSELITEAFGVKKYQLSMKVATNVTSEARYDIQAKVPNGASQQDVNLMIKTLLVERFGLVVHRETLELKGYDLVSASGGLRSKASISESSCPADDRGEVPDADSIKMGKDKDGLPQLEPGSKAFLSLYLHVGRRWTGRCQPLSVLSSALEESLGTVVRDRTGLTGTYDFTVTFVPDERIVDVPKNPVPIDREDAAPDLFTALRKQLLLNLQPKNIATEVVVIDRVNKTPVAN